MLAELHLFALALHRLLGWPLPTGAPRDAQAQRRSLRHHPAAGLVLGGLQAGAMWLATLMLPLPLAAFVALAAGTALTRRQAARRTHDWVQAAPEGVPRGPGLHGWGWLAWATFLSWGLRAGALVGLAHIDLLAAMAALPMAQAWSRAAIVPLLRHSPHWHPGDPPAVDQNAAATDSAARAHAAAKAQLDAHVDGELNLMIGGTWALWATCVGILALSPEAMAWALLPCAAIAVWWAQRCLGRHDPQRPRWAELATHTQRVAEVVALLALWAAKAWVG